MPEPGTDRPRIVVGVDGSGPSRAALKWAQRIAAAEHAEIEVIGAWIWPGALGLTGMPLEYSPKDDIEKELTEAVDAVYGPNRPADLQVRAVEGGAAHVLVQVSKDALMVVVGSRGIGGFMGLLLGSVSQHVAEHAKCPVLVIHNNEEETP